MLGSGKINIGMRVITPQEISDLPLIKRRGDCYLYKQHGVYYKIWNYKNSSFYMVDGLDRLWQGNRSMSSIDYGLIDTVTCSALIETLHSEDGSCTGYTMREGRVIDDSHPQFLEFVEVLVNRSIEVGYGMFDIHAGNIIELDGKLSLIDVDFHPIKLDPLKKFTDSELKCWYRTFGDDLTTEYFSLLRKKYLRAKYENC